MSKSILIATFSVWNRNRRTAISGMIEPLLSYFLPKNYDIDLIDGLHPGSSDVLTKIEQYRNKKLIKKTISYTSKILHPLLNSFNTNATQIIFKIRDFFSVLEWGIRSRKKYDIFIGMESIYTIAGIVLRKIGITRYVIYYVSDYSPKRYSQNWFNTIYVFLDKFCAKHSEYIWDVSPAMQKGRKQAGLEQDKSAPVIIVPNALFPSQIFHCPINEQIPHSLVFAGTLGLENGSDIAIKAVAKLVKKYPDISLHVFGGNEQGKETFLKKMAEDLKIKDHIFFHGFVNNAEELSRKINRYMIGLAPYKVQENSVRAFGDATKLRLYMGAGIPAITTSVPPLGKEIAEKGAALIAKDNETEFAKSIIKLFDKKTYFSMRDKAIQFGKNNTWENTYTTALNEMKLTGA